MSDDDVVDMLLSALGVLSCVIALALFLLWRGWGGWPKNALLLCRRCEYLLQGLDRPRICPECGADLTRRRAIRVGERRKRKRVLIIGVLTLLLAITFGGVMYNVFRTKRIDWDRVKPVWMLKREAQAATNALAPGVAPFWSSSALRELSRRAWEGDLSTAQLKSLAQIALDIQGDPNIPFESNWANIIESAYDAKLLTPEQVNRYVQQAYIGFPLIRAAARAHHGEPIAVDIQIMPTRVPRQGSSLFEGRVLSGIVMKVRMLDSGGDVISEQLTTFDPGVGARTLQFMPQRSIGVGEITLTCDVAVHWFEAGEDRRFTVREGEPIARWTASQVTTIEVIELQRPLIDLNPDESMRAAIVNATTVDMIAPLVTLSGGMFPGGGVVGIDGAPAAVSFDIFARSGDVEVHVGFLAADAGSCAVTHVHPHPTPTFPDANAVDFVLRTNPIHAERMLTITEIWDGEIVFPNVPIPPMPAVTRPRAPMPTTVPDSG